MKKSGSTTLPGPLDAGRLFEAPTFQRSQNMESSALFGLVITSRKTAKK
jgi:hypothetical protein